MGEKRYASYFEVVDLVDQILPAKSELDYSKTSPDDLIRRFDEAIAQSGYIFDEEILAGARSTLTRCFENIYGRNSFLLGGMGLKEPAPGYDQNNYNIQNQLSSAKNSLISSLGKAEQLPTVWNGLMQTRSLGNVSDLRARMTRDNIRNYIRSVVTSTWEGTDVIHPNANTIVYDILLHFGIKASNGSRYSEIYDKLVDSIEALEFSSKKVYGPRDREGYYEEARTIPELYATESEKTIDSMAGYIYDIWRKSLDREVARGNEKIPNEKTDVEAEDKPVENKTVVEISSESIGTEELEDPIKKYEELQAIIQENIKLEEEIRKLQEEIMARRTQITANTDRMKNLL